jgi:hypothetical protein
MHLRRRDATNLRLKRSLVRFASASPRAKKPVLPLCGKRESLNC